MINKRNFVVIGLMTALTVGAALTITNQKSLLSFADECSHTHVEHYDGVAPTLTSTGRPEHWACCECHKAWYDEARTREITGRADDYAVVDLAKQTEKSFVSSKFVPVDDINTVMTESDKVKCLDQTDWANTTTGKGAGTFSYYDVDGRRALRVSATDLTSEQKALRDANSSGFSEFRFTKAVTDCASVTFEYKFWDTNTELGTDGVAAHTIAQYKGAEYKTATMDLINDNQWHTITVTPDGLESYTITHFVMKIYHFAGELYITNMTIGDSREIDITKHSYDVERYLGGGWDTTSENLNYQENSTNGYVSTSSDGITVKLTGWAFYGITLPRFDFSNYQRVSYGIALAQSGTSGDNYLSLEQYSVSNSICTGSGVFNQTGTLDLVKCDDGSYKYTLSIDGETKTAYITNANQINGTAPIFLYVHVRSNDYCTVTFTSVTLKTLCSEHTYVSTIPTDCIGYKTLTCSECGYCTTSALMTPSDVDWTASHYSASWTNGQVFHYGEWAHADSTYKDYLKYYTWNGGGGNEDADVGVDRTLVLPRVNYSAYSGTGFMWNVVVGGMVSFGLNSTDFFYGKTYSYSTFEAYLRVYDITASSMKVALMFTNVGDAAYADSTQPNDFYYETTITDTDVISGTKGISLYARTEATYTRFIYVKPVTLDTSYSLTPDFSTSNLGLTWSRGNDASVSVTINTTGYHGDGTKGIAFDLGDAGGSANGYGTGHSYDLTLNFKKMNFTFFKTVKVNMGADNGDGLHCSFNSSFATQITFDDDVSDVELTFTNTDGVVTAKMVRGENAIETTLTNAQATGSEAFSMYFSADYGWRHFSLSQLYINA